MIARQTDTDSLARSVAPDRWTDVGGGQMAVIPAAYRRWVEVAF